MRGYSYNNVSTHTHDCDKCKFMFGVNYHNSKGVIVKTIDMYESCQCGYLIRHSSDGPDYYSGVTLEQLVTGWFDHMYPITYHD